MRQQSPSVKNSRVSSAQNNNSVAVSQIEKSKIENKQPATKHDRMKSYAKEQQNISKRNDHIDPAKLIEQNLKLKAQISELISHLDNIIIHQREKQQKAKEEKQKKHYLSSENQEELLRQEKEINANIQQIKLLQRKLEIDYNILKVKEREDYKYYIEKEYKKLYEEYESQQKVVEKQNQGLERMEITEIQQVLQKFKGQLNKEQKQSRAYIDQINQNEKEVQKLHSEKVSKLKKIQQLEQKIKEKKQRPKEEDITEEKIITFEEEIIELQKKKDKFVQIYGEKFKILDSQRSEVKIEIERKRNLLIKLEREIKINKVFIHEANRFLRMDERQSQRSSKPVFSAPRKSQTPRKETPSPKSEKGSIKKQPSQKKVETIKEEQFEETVLNVDQIQKSEQQNQQLQEIIQNQELNEKVPQQIEEEENNNNQQADQLNQLNLSTHEDETKSMIDQQENTQPAQPNIYKKPMMMLKKKN